MRTLTAKELALYLGCEAYADANNGEFTMGIISGFEPNNKHGYYVLITCEKYCQSVWPVDCIKPILRPLSDITEQEAKEIKYDDISQFWEYSNTDLKGDLAFFTEEFIYLLSKRFDLFNWIEQGLAIAKEV